MGNLRRRLTEPSTYSSIAVILALVGINVEQGLVDAVMMIGSGISAVLGIFLREKSDK